MVENEVSSEQLLRIPLRAALKSSKSRRADTALSLIKKHVSQHTNAPLEKIWIDTRVNEEIWKNGRENIPSHILVKIIKLQEGTTEVIMP